MEWVVRPDFRTCSSLIGTFLFSNIMLDDECEEEVVYLEVIFVSI